MTPADFRECLAALRWSQRSLADLLRTHPTTVRRWATGQQPIPINVQEWLECLSQAHRGNSFPRDWFKLDESGSGVPIFDEHGRMIPVNRD